MILLDLFFSFFQIGLFTFGGGYAMLPMIRQQIAAHGWMTEQALIDFIAVSESTPGPFAINISTFVGMQTAGVAGAACATLGVVLPSFAVILVVAKIYDKFRKSLAVKGCMSGLKPAVVGLIAAATLSVAAAVFFPSGLTLSVFSGAEFYVSAAIVAVCAVLAFKKVHPILLILLSAAVGVGAGFAGLIE